MQVNPEDFQELKTQVSNLNLTVKHLQKDIEDFVSKQEFAPVKLIAYGLATAVMTSVFMAIMAKVLIK
jgi:hypothetical protein